MAALRNNEDLPLIVIAGPTASGKTSAAIALGKKYNGEIICADSRTIYREMDIGTAKPSLEERMGVPHFGLDLVEPGQRFTVADFKSYTVQKIKEIRERNHLPILVGGSGLYIDGIIFDFQFGGEAEPAQRNKFEAMTLDELYRYCSDKNIKLPENYKNPRYVIRAIERHAMELARRNTPIDNCVLAGIVTESSELRNRIVHRSEQLFDNGVVDEAKKLGEKYGWNSEAMTGNIYPLIKFYLEGKVTETQMHEQFAQLDWRLAKRQMTWLRRNPFIEWCEREEVVDYVSDILETEH